MGDSEPNSYWENPLAAIEEAGPKDVTEGAQLEPETENTTTSGVNTGTFTYSDANIDGLKVSELK